MKLRNYIPPMSIVLFIVVTLAGTYFVRRLILEKTMITAMEIGDSATVAELADSFPSPINARDKRQRTPLHRAADWGDRALVELLLVKGADVNARDKDGQTPLHWACTFGRTRVVETLIAKGADIDPKDVCGSTPLHLAALCGHREVVELLLADGAGINTRIHVGWTPLHLAADCGRKEVVELLISKGADLAAKDVRGSTALRLALRGKHDAVAEVLRKAGAKDSTEERGVTIPQAVPKVTEELSFLTQERELRRNLLESLDQDVYKEQGTPEEKLLRKVDIIVLAEELSHPRLVLLFPLGDAAGFEVKTSEGSIDFIRVIIPGGAERAEWRLVVSCKDGNLIVWSLVWTGGGWDATCSSNADDPSASTLVGKKPAGKEQH